MQQAISWQTSSFNPEFRFRDISNPTVLAIKPIVSVKVTTYNHENFIAKALDGILAQHCNFPFEVVVGEDCSTDRTFEIVFEYQQKYPNVIRLIQWERNTGGRTNSRTIEGLLRGKYIAFHEGDDYWIDPLKLQKQVNCLEDNPMIKACFTNAVISDEVKNLQNQLHFPINDRKLASLEIKQIVNPILGAAELLDMQRVLIITWMVRADFGKFRPDWLRDAPYGDRAIAAILADNGGVYYLPDVTAVYRLHEGGVWTGDKDATRKYEKSISIFIKLDEYFNLRFTKIIAPRIASLYMLIAKAYAKRELIPMARHYTNKAKESLSNAGYIVE